jgi:hypothetical protein
VRGAAFVGLVKIKGVVKIKGLDTTKSTKEKVDTSKAPAT